jgi:hypothetical protein
LAETTDYYAEKKWCSKCRQHVRYLLSVYHSYCIRCGAIVTLFSRDEWRKINRKLETMKTSRNGHTFRAGRM